MLFNKFKTQMIDAEHALPGRPERPFALTERHRALDAPLVTDEVPAGYEVALFGLGCFWGAEEIFWQVPGVGSQSNGMSNFITAIPWGTDPLGTGNVPPASLGSGMYTWQILVQDTNGNSATTQTYFQIP